MAKKTEPEQNLRNHDAIIIAITIVIVAAIILFVRDREQKRNYRLQRIDKQMDVWEEWPPTKQNTGTNNTTGQSGGKIL